MRGVYVDHRAMPTASKFWRPRTVNTAPTTYRARWPDELREQNMPYQTDNQVGRRPNAGCGDAVSE